MVMVSSSMQRVFCLLVVVGQLIVETRALVVPGGLQKNQIKSRALQIRALPSQASVSSFPHSRQVVLRSTEKGQDGENRLPWYFDPGTYGGVIVLTILALIVPFVLYSILLQFGLDPNQTGIAISGIVVVGATILWTLSYVFRVFTKQMTYGQQLKQYEDAVIQKRFEELEDDEVEALLSDIEREELAAAKDDF